MLKQTKYLMRTELTITEQINRALDKEGRKQTWIIAKLNGMGFNFTDATFSRKKMGYNKFEKEELEAISTLLSVTLKY